MRRSAKRKGHPWIFEKKIAVIFISSTLFLSHSPVLAENDFSTALNPLSLRDIQIPSTVDVSSTYYRGDSVFAMIKGGTPSMPDLLSAENANAPSVIYVSNTRDHSQPVSFIARNGLATGETLNDQINYNPATRVLTLNHFTDCAALVIANTDNVTINLIGDNTMLPGGYVHCPASANLTITGEGSLTFSQSDQGNLVDFFSIEAESLIINGGTLNLDGTAIKGTSSTTINGGELNLTNPNGHCIVSQDTIALNGGTLNLIGGNDKTRFSALFCKTGSIYFAPDFSKNADPTASTIKLTSQPIEKFSQIIR
jgi:hypothetical protein